MFVRWKKRRCKKWDWREADTTYSLYLVESKRIDGKPRQKVIAFLGSIRITDDGHFHFCKNLFHDVGARALFLEWTEKRLSALEVADAEKQRLLEQIAKVVPRPTDEERSAYEEEEERSRATTRALLQRGGW